MCSLVIPSHTHTHTHTHSCGVGILHQVRMEDKLKSPSRNSGKVRSQPRHCFLFSKHLLITARLQKKPQDQYRMVKVIKYYQVLIELKNVLIEMANA